MRWASRHLRLAFGESAFGKSALRATLDTGLQRGAEQAPLYAAIEVVRRV